MSVENDARRAAPTGLTMDPKIKKIRRAEQEVTRLEAVVEHLAVNAARKHASLARARERLAELKEEQ